MDLKGMESSAKPEKKQGATPPFRLQDIGLPRLLLIVAAGVGLLVLSMPSGWFGGSDGNAKQTARSASETVSDSDATAMEVYTDKKEKQLEEILAKVEGIGKAEVMITLDSTEEQSKLTENTKVQKVEGVLVVAEGAGNAQTDTEIIQAVQALFSLESHKIRVMKME